MPLAPVSTDDYSAPANLRPPLARLYRITGFVTTLHPENDLRPLVFARYYHVRRVVWLAHAIGSRHSTIHNIDISSLNWLAWAHDLNRWPFAHNSERGIYNQAEDLPRYFAETGLSAAPKQIVELQAIIDKAHEHLSIEGRIVLLADIIAGFIEDPLWAIIGLDLIPEIVPPDVASVLCIPLSDSGFRSRLRSLNDLLFTTRSPELFAAVFDDLFKELSLSYVEHARIADELPLGHERFESDRRVVKESFMRKCLFPYNNEKVSHGSLLKTKLVKPLIASLQGNINAILTTIDEPALLTLALNLGVIDQCDISLFFPDVDYVTNAEPDRSFRRSAASFQEC
jgi:hypothetical protein